MSILNGKIDIYYIKFLQKNIENHLLLILMHVMIYFDIVFGNFYQSKHDQLD